MRDLGRILSDLTALLQEKKGKIATAESCTGGLIAGLLTELPGSSVWFERGFVTYSNQAKQDLLGVDATLLQQVGAVSKEVAEAMATGCLAQSKSDVALAVTGIAGPDGGSVAKPVGTVYFAFAMEGFPVQSLHCHFKNLPRHEVRRLACQEALKGVLAYLNSSPINY
ncbi:MAG: CinA family protein [Tatlockia sp.]|jgi:nicotinamide-nucleotide amidase